LQHSHVVPKKATDSKADSAVGQTSGAATNTVSKPAATP